MDAADATASRVISLVLVALGFSQPASDIACAPEKAMLRQVATVPGPALQSAEALPMGPSKLRIESLELSACCVCPMSSSLFGASLLHDSAVKMVRTVPRGRQQYERFMVVSFLMLAP